MRKSFDHTGMDLALAAVGSRHQLARKLGLSPAAVHKWKDIPIKRLLEVEDITGIHRSKLRPDIFKKMER
jgi:DNA-binding transcriptional regulator YdaS (Cro superfamily)